MKKRGKKDKIVIYQAPGGGIELRGDVSNETIWAIQLLQNLHILLRRMN